MMLRASMEANRTETLFNEQHRAVLALLGFDARGTKRDRRQSDAVCWDCYSDRAPFPIALMDLIAIVLGEIVRETRCGRGSGPHIGLRMAKWRSASIHSSTSFAQDWPNSCALVVRSARSSKILIVRQAAQSGASAEDSRCDLFAA